MQPLIWEPFRFTVLQAGLSALFSVMFGVILARVVISSSHPFWRRLEPVMLLPFFLPSLFVVIAVVKLYGHSGLGFDIFGLFGIVIAHAILNIPLVFFLAINDWRRMPIESVHLAVQLGGEHRLLLRPHLRRVVPLGFALVFLYASLSFPIALTLGGVLGARTLELAIYEALRYDFDIALALRLGAMQLCIGLIMFSIIYREREAQWPVGNSRQNLPLPHVTSPLRWLTFLTTIFLMAPLAAWLLRLWPSIDALIATLSTQSFLIALANSLWMAVAVALGANLAALLLILVRIEIAAWLVAAISPLVISTVAILLLRQWVNPFDYGLIAVIILQILAMLPLILRIWREAILEIAPEERRLARGIMADRWTALRLFWWPNLKLPIRQGLVIAAALAIGDLALLPLFAPPGFTNLPLLIWQMIASYRFEAAWGLASVILAMIALILALSNRGHQYA